MEKAHK
jgi:hypothetical protein